MKNKFTIFSFCCVFGVLLASCGKETGSDNTMISSSKKNETAVSSVNREDKSSVSDTASTSESTEQTSNTIEAKRNIKLEEYNKLPLGVKIQLIAEIVDDRVYPVDGKSLHERGYGLVYYAYADYVVLQVGSGAGVGHPIFVLDYDTETVIPREGVVRAGSDTYEIMTDIDGRPISKEILYDNYLANKDAYDNGIEDTFENEQILEYFESQKRMAIEQTR